MPFKNKGKPKQPQMKPETQSKLSQAGDLEAKLSKLDANAHSSPHPIPEDKKSTYQTKLVELFSEVILTDPTVAMRKDVPSRLWRFCFYGRIGELRNRVNKEKMRWKKMQKKKADGGGLEAAAATSTVNTASSAEAETQKKKIQTNEVALNTFLKESVTLYDWLVNQIMAQLVQSYTNSQLHSQSSTESLLSDVTDATKALKGQIPILHRMYIYLGDLHRYSSSLSNAETSYLKASCLAPGKGNPYNQLAVVAQLKDPTGTHPLPAVALYWYCRSLLAVNEPFETSWSNMERLFITNKNWMEKHMAGEDIEDLSGISTIGMNREQARATKSAASRKFLCKFVAYHGFLLEALSFSPSKLERKWDSEKVEMEMSNLVRHFDALLAESAFSDALLLKIVCIMAFSVWNASHSTITSPATEDTRTLPFMTAVTLSYQLGATLTNHVTSSIDKITGKKKVGGAPVFTGNIRLLSPLLLFLEFIAYIGDKEGDKAIAKLMEKTVSDEDLQKLWSKSRQSLWEEVAKLSNLLRDTSSITTFLESGEEEAGEAEAGLLPKEFLLLAKGYKPFSFLLLRRDEKSQQILSSQQSSKSTDTSTQAYAYLPLDEAIDALEVSGGGTGVLSQSTALSQQSRKSIDSKNPAKAAFESRLKLRWAMKFTSDCVDKGILALGDGGIVGAGLVTDVADKTDDYAGPILNNPVGDAVLPPPMVSSPPMIESVTVETTGQRQDEEDVIVYKPTDCGKALLVPGALLLADTKRKEDKKQDNIAAHSMPIGTQNAVKQTGDVRGMENNGGSSTDLLSLSSLLNGKPMKEVASDSLALDPPTMDKPSLPRMPQSTEPPSVNDRPSQIRPPPGFHSTFSAPTEQTNPSTAPSTMNSAPPGLGFVGNSALQQEAATLTTNLPAFSGNFQSNVDITAPGLGSFLNETPSTNPFGTRNPFAISMPSLGYGNPMTLGTTQMNGSNEIPPNQSSRLAQYTGVKTDTPTDTNSLSFDFDQNDFLKNLGIFTTGDEDTAQAGEHGNGLSSAFSSQNGNLTTEGSTFASAPTDATTFTKNPFA